MYYVWKRKETKKKKSRESCYHRPKEDTHLLSWVENSGLLEDLAHNGHSRVDRVRDDEDKRLGAVLSARLGKIAHNSGIDLFIFIRICCISKESGTCQVNSSTGGEREKKRKNRVCPDVLMYVRYTV